MEMLEEENNLILILPVLLPALGGILSGVLRSMKPLARRYMVFLFLALTIASVLPAATAVNGGGSLILFQPVPSVPMILRPDRLGFLYAAFISFVFCGVGLYSFEYMHHEENEHRFYAFYLLTLAALMGLSLSGSIVTFYMFYEAMTLLSLPLVAHTMTKEAVAAAIKYLIYSVIGASMALAGIFILAQFCSTLMFTPGGVLDPAKAAGREDMLRTVFFVMIIGFSVKAGMFPLHGWLATAHPAAPAPASAVLSGVITKAGVLGIIRVIYYLAGPGLLRGTWVQAACLVLSMITIVLGSLLAFKEDVFKKRLAYSTVSQASYILFGLFTMTEAGMVGAVLHILFHSLIKNTLFMTAGAVIVKTGKTKVEELAGIGRQMPAAMACYTIVSLGLIGIPPTCGFISKWYLAQGGLSTAYAWNFAGPAVLLLSAILTAGYLFSIVIRGFFPGANADETSLPKAEPGICMLLPMALFSLLCLLGGMFPGSLAGMIAEEVRMLL